ncbi:MAG: heparin lyase I family protein, partial [Hymenobacteraceae bacterium]|nr:heparin lyase I family protein [Hymenobacteraceae bacterium]
FTEQATPPTGNPEILYSEGFESGTGFTGMHLQSSTLYGFTVVESPTFSGAKVGRFELRKGDPEASGGARTEVLFTEALAQETTWHSFAAYFPSIDYKDDTISYEVNTQWHQGSSWGTPMLQLRILNGRIYFNRRSNTNPQVQYDLGPQPKDQWVKFVIHLKQHTRDGFVKIWINDQQVLHITGETMFPDKDPVPYGRWKLGIYKSDWNKGGTYKPSSTTIRVWYVDEVKIGSATSTYKLMEPTGNNISILPVQQSNTQSLLADSWQKTDVKFEVYPTLARRGENITVKTAGQEAFVTDVAGRTVYATPKGTGTFSINTTNLPAGMYIINLPGSKGLPKQKFLVTD